MVSFPVTLKAGSPIYEQVIFAVKKAIVCGQLKPGDRFPSVRELSKELRINPNTAQKAVAALVHQRLLVIEPGIGSTVAPPGEATKDELRTILDSEAEKLVIEAKRFSITKEELIQAISGHWEDSGEEKSND